MLPSSSESAYHSLRWHLPSELSFLRLLQSSCGGRFDAPDSMNSSDAANAPLAVGNLGHDFAMSAAGETKL